MGRVENKIKFWGTISKFRGGAGGVLLSGEG